jgi:UDP-glucose 4-epimerase
MWHHKRVLVTGADGFIGSHLTEALVAAGAEVTALAQYNAFDHHGWLDELDAGVRTAVRLVRADVRDGAAMARLVEGQDYVFHLAALISVPHSYDAPASHVATNAVGTLNLLEAVRRSKVTRLIHTSTSEVYGTARTRPISEDHPLTAQSPYAASKIAADKLVEAYHLSYGLPAVTIRPFNAYGPRQSERALIATAIRQSIDDTAAIDLGRLEPERDFTYVSDTVEAFLAVAALDAAHCGAVFNVGSGVAQTIGRCVELIVELTGCDKPIRPDPARERPADSEVMALIADASRLRAATGWRPKVELTTGLRRTIDWWRSRPQLRPPGTVS